MRRFSSALTSGRRSTPRTKLKMAALAPMPNASVSTTVIASPLVRPSERSATLRSPRNNSGFRLIVRYSLYRGVRPAAYFLPDSRSSLHKNPREILPVTNCQYAPQNCDNNRNQQARPVQEQVKQKNVHDYRAKKDEREWYVAVHQQQHAARKLNATDKEDVVRLEKYRHELACKSRRQRPHWDEVQEAIQPKHKEDQPKQNSGDQCGNFHWMLLFFFAIVANSAEESARAAAPRASTAQARAICPNTSGTKYG